MIKKALAWIPKSPMETILTIIASGLAAYAIYYMLPVSLGAGGIVSTVFNTLEEHIIVGLVLLVPCAISLQGVWQRDYEKMHTGSFLVMLAFGFLTLLRILVLGFGSTGGWILLLIPAAVSMVCYLYFGWKKR